MNSNAFQLASARVCAGAARRDITPPLGIYSRCWGAALHDTATAVHRPFTLTALALQEVDGTRPLVILAIDLCWFETAENERFLSEVREATGLAAEELIANLGHSHAALNLSGSLADKPGGDKIVPYFESVIAASIEAIREAAAVMRPAWMTADYGRCSLAVNRDYPDADFGEVVCGFNPDVPADDTLAYTRIADDQGETIATIVNYGCHPTTLGPANVTLSPDYIGAARSTVEETSGGPCLFLIGACGDTAPREGYSGDPDLADKNGRQLGYAAASVAASLLPPGEELVYAGPMLSGATLAVWDRQPMDSDEPATVRTALLDVELPLRAKVGLETLRERERDASARLAEAEASGDTVAVRNATAIAERARRAVLREPLLPEGDSLAIQVWIWQMGRIAFVALPAEPFSPLQVALRDRFADLCVIFCMNSNGTCGYLMPKTEYGRGLYQEWASPTGRGGFEAVDAAVSKQLEEWNG